jgi:hypothetical protein
MLCLWLSELKIASDRQQRAVAEVLRLGGRISYDWEDERNGRDRRGVVRLWLMNVGRKDYLEEVVGISFAGTELTDADLSRLHRHLAGLRNVRELRLSRTDVSSDGVAMVVGMPEMAKLFLDGTKIDDGALRHVAAMPGLRVLMLNQTAVTDAGLPHLARCRALRLVNLYETAVTAEGVDQLQSELPALRIGTPQDGLGWGEE